ncbi:MAG: FAD-binding protein [Zoogloeaceae bacterium]|jgi:electron transfer flavoprotein alpha subunit|nr:FAD-binding protein [Zoogloeaceae bacterium]
MTTLVIAEHDHASLKAVTRNALAAAAKAGGDIHLLVAGNNASGAANQGAACAGVAKVLLADAPHYATFSVENLAALVASVGGNYSHIFAPASALGKNLMPRVAALLDVAQISDIIAVQSADTFVRPIYAGNALATVQSADKVKIVTVRATAFAPVGDGGSAPVETLAAQPDTGLSRQAGLELIKSERPELASAKVVVAGGRGMGSAENFRKLLEPLADKLNAALGATRAAVDAGFVTNDCQVGQTGKIVAPQLYIAAGISGAIQHLAGMKDSKVIVAINKNADEPIFQVADYGLVADLNEALPELIAKL